MGFLEKKTCKAFGEKKSLMTIDKFTINVVEVLAKEKNCKKKKKRFPV